MIKSIIRVGLFLVAGILVYNYFYGSDTEKEQSKQFFQEVKDLGGIAWDLLKSEKEKLDEGKYDEALDNIGGLFERMKSEAEKGGQAITRINDLELERQNLEDRLQRMQQENTASSAPQTPATPDEEDLKRDIKKLFEKAERLVDDFEQDRGM